MDSACCIFLLLAFTHQGDERSHIPSSWMVHAAYFCCWHSPIKVMNVRIFWVCTMECMRAQIRPCFILSSERGWGFFVFFGGGGGGMESEPMSTPREKSPLPENFSLLEDWTHDTASSRTASPTHHQWAIPAPTHKTDFEFKTTTTTTKTEYEIQ